MRAVRYATRPEWAGAIQVGAAFLLLALFSAGINASILGCLSECHVDTMPYGSSITNPSPMWIYDTRLTIWILGWAQHALLTAPLDIFNANTFHPAAQSLAGSEHMIGVAAQLLPIRLFTDNAVFVHQFGLVLSSLILSWTTFWFVWDTERSMIAGITAGALAMLMPWRLTEIAHFQLLNLQWLPLIWLLLARVVEGRAGPLTLVMLTLSMSVQVLSSIYLAFFTLLSGAALLGTLLIYHRSRIPQAAIRLAIAGALPALLLLLTSLPYLMAEASGSIDAFPTRRGFGWTKVLNVLTPIEIVPSRFGIGRYAIPVAVLLLLPFSFVGARRADAPPTTSTRDSRARLVALWSIVILAILISAGPGGHAGTEYTPMPYDWLSWAIPGFSNLRAPTRWTILIGIAAPIIAGVGLSRLARFSSRKASTRWLSANAIMTVILIAAIGTIGLPEIPVAQAFPPSRAMRVYDRLAELPDGPVLELPWKWNEALLNTESAYTLASTRHWKKVLNGYTGYKPPSYLFLHEIGGKLPDVDVVEQLSRLASLRWIVVHKKKFRPQEQRKWRALIRAGSLRARYEDADSYIMEVADRSNAGVWTDDLLSSEQRTTTFGGVERGLVEPSMSTGSITAEPPEFMYSETPFGFRGEYPIRVDVRNDSGSTWPAFDSDREGLVQVRIRFFPTNGGQAAVEQRRLLTSDVEAGSVESVVVIVAPPASPGTYRLQVDLIQRLDTHDVPLEIAPAEYTVRVEQRGKDGQT
jgi:hypothetical protein